MRETSSGLWLGFDAGEGVVWERAVSAGRLDSYLERQRMNGSAWLLEYAEGLNASIQFVHAYCDRVWGVAEGTAYVW